MRRIILTMGLMVAIILGVYITNIVTSAKPTIPSWSASITDPYCFLVCKVHAANPAN